MKTVGAAANTGEVTEMEASHGEDDDWIDDLYRAFDYPDDTECQDQLRSLENQPDDLRRELIRAMATLRE